MIDHRKYENLPGGIHGWLNAKHHFPIGGKPDPLHMPVGALYVWNDDQFAPRSGFGMHPHVDVEIITYVRSGSVTHVDSLGNQGQIEAGDVQVISAGTGIRHSEKNMGDTPLQLFQIWLQPNAAGGAPAYGSKQFPREERDGSFITLASGLAADIAAGALPLRADARLLGATVKAGYTLMHRFDKLLRAYLVPASGCIELNGRLIQTGDGVAISDEPSIVITALEDSELVMVEVA